MAIKKNRYRTFALICLIVSILFASVRIATPWLSQKWLNQAEFKQNLEQKFGLKIKNSYLEWYWFQPVLALESVSYEKNNQILNADKAYIGIDFINSIWNWSFQPGLIYVKNAHLYIQEQKPSASSFELPLTTMSRFILENITVQFKTLEGKTLRFTNLELRAKNVLGRIHVLAEAKFNNTRIKILADLFDWQGQIYTQIHQLDFHPHDLPNSWIAQLPKEVLALQHIMGDAELWIDVAHKQWQGIQAKFQLSQIKIKTNNNLINNSNNSNNLNFNSLNANMHLKKIPTGWQLSADKIKLCSQSNSLMQSKSKSRIQCLPENIIHVNYQASTGTYKAFIKTWEFSSFMNHELSKLYTNLDTWNPQGTLKNIQLTYQYDQGLLFFLTQFNDLGWKKQVNIPGISHLSGVIYWQPNEGHLEIDSNHTQIFSPNNSKLLPLELTTANIGMEWRLLSHGYRIHWDHIILTSPELVFSARGVWDEPGKQNSQMRLQGEFSAQHAEKILSYIPSDWLKPKLNAWLKNDIYRIKKINGKFDVIGPVSDIRVNSYLSGVDLSFHPNWPRVNNIDAFLNVKHGDLEATVVHAELGDAALNAQQIHLKVDQLGSGHESLLIHGKLEESFINMMKYIKQSPLKNRLENLQKLTFNHTIPVDIKLEVPLFPEDNNVYVKGSVVLEDQTAVLQDIQTQKNPLVLTHVNGIIGFTESGVIESPIKAMIWEQPIDFTVKTLGSDVQFLTDLKAISLDLPAPLSKKAGESKQLQIILKSQANSEMTIKADYDHILSLSAKNINPNEWLLLLKLKEWGAELKYNKSMHMLSGHIPQIWIDTTKLFDKNSKNRFLETVAPQDIPNLDITVDQLHWNNRDLGLAELKSKSFVDHWQLEQLSLRTDAYSFGMKGHWNQNKITDLKDDVSQIEAQINIRDLGKSLRYWKMPTAVDAKRGNIVLNGEWHKPFFLFALADFKGEASMSLKNGSITHLDKETQEKIGLGKLLSILSLQTIPRRLTLDFSDLSDDGYSFDLFEGHFQLKNAVMNTQDTYVDGPVAYATMKGDLDLDKRLYDVNLQVYPHIAASLPIVATIAGGPVAGPVAGIATWMAIKILNHGVEKISSYSYHISGPWLDPVVQQISISKKK